MGWQINLLFIGQLLLLKTAIPLRHDNKTWFYFSLSKNQVLFWSYHNPTSRNGYHIYKTFCKTKLCNVTYPKAVKEKVDRGDASFTHAVTTLLYSAFSVMQNFYWKSTYHICILVLNVSLRNYFLQDPSDWLISVPRMWNHDTALSR